MIEVLDLIKKTYAREEAEEIIHAYYFAKAAHEGQKRASGEEYFIHPCCVSMILIDLGLDYKTICAAFLHDTIEDTAVSEGDIEREFGKEVLSLVQGVTKLEKIEFKSKKEEQAENFKKIFISMAHDIRVIIIKLADRLHNMRSLNFLSKTRQLAIANETLDIYAPLAGRLGISQIKCELEDLCLKYLDPEAYEFLNTSIASEINDRKRFINLVIEELRKILDESGIKGEVNGRTKHYYSIYKKMKSSGKDLSQIYDLSAVRVIVESVNECYEILGKVHNRWSPIPGRIKDYIATPKANMYQSLHTTVVTSFGKVFEIQIRTFEMHRTAEFGIAAHWKYKEQKVDETDLDKRLSWIREVVDWQSGLNSIEFVESLKGDIYSPQEVLVFTPKGEVINLAVDSTPIDFAYRIHTEVGNKCTGAKVNGKIVPLSYKLATGDIVEIITSKNSKGPSWDWLKIVATPSARAKIKQFFKRNMQEEHVRIGKSMLENLAKQKGYTLSSLITNANFEKVSEKMNFNTIEEMYAAVGCGAVSPQQVLYKFIDIHKKEIRPDEPFVNKNSLSGRASSGDVIIKGVDGLLIRFAGCCNPVPGDNIVGFVSRGRGVTVHRSDCPNIAHEDQDRILPAEWTGKAGDSYVVSLKIIGTENAPLMYIVSSACSVLGLFCISFNGRIDSKNKTSVADMAVRLNKKDDLELLIKKLKEYKEIIDVFRAIV